MAALLRLITHGGLQRTEFQFPQSPEMEAQPEPFGAAVVLAGRLLQLASACDL